MKMNFRQAFSKIPVCSFFLLVFLFWFFAYNHHIAYWEETDFFLFSRDYFSGYAWQLGGWSEYAGNFLAQFYRWRIVGALLQTLFVVAVWWSANGISKRFYAGGWPLLSLLPALIVFAAQCNYMFTVGESLRVTVFFVLGYLYVRLDKADGLFLYTLLYPLCAMLLSPVGVLTLYASFIIYEAGRGKWLKQGAKPFIARGVFSVLGRNKNAGFLVLAFWIILCVAWPQWWQHRVYAVAENNLYALSSVLTMEFARNLLAAAYGWLPFLSLFFLFFAKRKFTPSVGRMSVALVVVVGVGYYLLPRAYEKEAEILFQVDQAAARGDWDEVLQVAADKENQKGYILYFTTLALANKGELPERLFEYPVKDESCLFLPRVLRYPVLTYGAELYNRLGVYNEVIHWNFEAAMTTPWGMNFRIAKHLIEMYILKSDFVLADKYLSILDLSTCHKGWVKEKRAEIVTLMGKEPWTKVGDKDFFIGARPFLSDMARLYDADNSNQMALDYVLCGLLLQKDIQKFCSIFTLKDWNGVKIPRAYEEAILVAEALGHMDGKKYQVSSRIRQEFLEYNVLLNQNKGNRTLTDQAFKKYANTWWYYLHFKK